MTDHLVMKRVVLFFACIMLLLVVSGCSQPGSQPVQPAQSPVATTAPPATPLPVATPVFVPKETTPTVSDNTIRIQNMAFNPPTMTVKAGAIVRWVNMDSVPHSIKFTKVSGINPSDPLSVSQGFSVKFDEPGTFAYSCAIHPSMQGTIIVE
jgi:plastocyanin